MEVGSLSHRVSVQYQDQNIHVAAAPGSPLPDGIIEEQVIVNWSTTFNSADDRYYVRVFGKNLTDERYRTGILPVANLWTMTSYGAPRWFGGEVGVQFDF
jgi:iron complex outermembrane receptor protein